MSSRTTFAEISPSEFARTYAAGFSIQEIARSSGSSYTGVRNSLIRSGVTPRSKEDGTRAYIARHPEWPKQFVRYTIPEGNGLTESKVILLVMVATEGYTDATSVGFTNTQERLHEEFRRLFGEAYGKVHLGRNGLTTRASSTMIAREIRNFLPNKTFSGEVLGFILESPSLLRRSLRMIADTEGSFIIYAKRAPRNFTVEARIVLASYNELSTRQIHLLLSSLGIEGTRSRSGITINKKSHIARFIQMVGFSPGVRVVRKKAGNSVWFGCQKEGLANLFLYISAKQKQSRASGLRGCFADCRSRAQTVGRLHDWYEIANGGGMS